MVETWEEFIKYRWDNGGLELSARIIDNDLYYCLPYSSEHLWITNVYQYPVSLLTRTWSRVGKAREPLTPQEAVCQKIGIMEKRWKNFQERKHNG